MANAKTHSLGDIIREARVRDKITLRDLAKKLGKSPSYISDIENDRRVPGEVLLREICDEFSLSFDELMGLAGRIGDQTERQLRKTPLLGLVFRKVSNLPPDAMQDVLLKMQKIVEKKEQ